VVTRDVIKAYPLSRLDETIYCCPRQEFSETNRIVVWTTKRPINTIVGHY